MSTKLRDLLDSVLRRPAVTAEMIICLRQFAIMHSAGIAFARSVRIISEQVTENKLRSILCCCQRRIESGKTIASAFAEFPDVFPELYARLIEVGERTGKLGSILESIAAHAEKAQKTSLKLKAALMYPACVMALCLAFMILGPTLLMRGLFEFITGLNSKLPLLTRGLIGLSAFMSSPLFPLAALFAAIPAVALARRMWQQRYWRRCLQNMVLALPGIGPYYLSLQMATFSRTLAIVHESGIPLIQGLELVQKSVSLIRFQDELESVIEQVKEGKSLYDALLGTDFFPVVILQFIKAGEESGELGRMLVWAAWVCDENNDQKLDIATEALQPLVLLVIGVIVGLLIVAIMAPMLKIVQEIS
jgi:type II secretory pathway component PulF